MGAKQSGTSQTTSTVNTGPWAPQQPYLQDAFAQAQANYGTAKDNKYYTGETVAPFNAAQNNALGTTIGLGSSTNPGVAAAGQNNVDTLSGKYLDPSSNPWLKSTFDAAAAPVTRAYMTATAPQTAGAMESAGRYGSGAYQNQVKNNEANLGASLNNLAANIYGNNYQTERGNQMTAAGQSAGLNSAQYINPTAALTAGNQQQQQQQNVDQSNMSAYNYNRDQPTNALNNYIAQIQGNYGQSGTTTPYYSNPGASALGGVLGAASLFTPGAGGSSAASGIGSALSGIGSFLSKSDRRLKTDIRLIGKSFDGQNIYAYRFLGEPNTQIGLMAQEVRDRVPEAVVEHPSTGVLMVDYAAALSRAI